MKNSIRFKIRRSIDSLGYIRIKLPEHPHAASNGWVREHIVVALASAGLQKLPDGQCVHHKNGVKTDNHPENLEIIPTGAHIQKHMHRAGNRVYGEDNPLIYCACRCGEKLWKFDNRGRPRIRILGHHRGARWK